MKWRPDPAHTTAWSGVGAAIMLVGVGAWVPLALANRLSSAHIPSLLINGCGVLALIGGYITIAPLVKAWPWSPNLSGPLLLLLVVGVATTISLPKLDSPLRGTKQHERSSRPHTLAAHTTSAPTPPTDSGGGGGVQPPSDAIPTELYSGAHFSTEIPAGWRIEENEVHKPGEIESTWVDPAAPGNTLLIDLSSATDLTAEQDAAPVHMRLLRQDGYHELYYGTGDLTGTESWMWVFRLPNSQRIDYFFTRCSTSFGVLGSTLPAQFDALQATFRSVAQSVRANCQ
jgi:hypothetical protein